MTKSAAAQVEHLDAMECGSCGAMTRLYGIEAHPALRGAELLTYACPRCDHVQTQAVPAPSRKRGKPANGFVPDKAFDAETTRLLGAAFDAAWETVLGSGQVDARHAAGIRESLAKRIIEMVQGGERSQQRLVEKALRLWQAPPAVKIELAAE